MNPLYLLIFEVICVTVIIKDFLLSLLLVYNFKRSSDTEIFNYPFVSILIAARNEAATIERCVECLSTQDYPEDKYEIIVGNDRSNDQTLEILKNLENKIRNLSVVNIDKKIKEHEGKMNVLAQIGELARGEILLFTDSDTEVPSSWIKKMSSELMNGRGIVTGTTLVKTSNTFSRFQRMEWIHAIGMMKVVSDLNIDVSSIGNNMGISRKAYDSVGGFMGIPFSITEDYEIFRQICRKGFSSFHIFEPQALSVSLPSENFITLIMQRKRWMFGAFRLPALMLLLLILNSLYYPIIFILLFFKFGTGMLILLLRIFLQGLFIRQSFNKLKEKVRWSDLLLFEFYSGLVNLGALILFILPVRVRWKGRKY